MKKSKAVFKFKPFSDKQCKVLKWWMDPQVKDMDGIIADGAIRSGKTLVMSLSFVFWAMESFHGQNFAMCGKTIGSFRRNVLMLLKLMLKSRGYRVKDHRADNLLVITRNGVENNFYIFGGKDESSQDLIQGITLAGLFCDEVALMPESFVNQATGRCSVDGSKFWFNCNPAGPYHWFKVNWIDKRKEKRLIYLHFTMDDNLSLSERIKERYRSMYSGVFYQRYILGLWVVAEGVVYKIFSEHKDDYKITVDSTLKKQYQLINIGVDFGGNKSGHTFVASGITLGFNDLDALASRRYLDKDIDPSKLEDLFIEFIKLILFRYGRITCIYCDSAEQTLIKGFRKALQKAGLPIRVKDALKCEINERIRATNRLMTQKRFHYTEDCETLEIALSSALWDAKKATEDVRLDNGSTDIDTLDGFEYSFERSINKLIRYE